MPLIRLFTTAEAPGDLLTEIRRLVDDAFGGQFSDDEHHTAVVGMSWSSTAVSSYRMPPSCPGSSMWRIDRCIGYVEAVATAPGRQREGLGALAMGEVATVLRREFEMGAISTGLHEFYGRLGWERWRGPTFVRTGPETIRTEDEDDGVMVLRFGRSRDIDLAAPISCEARPGDDW